MNLSGQGFVDISSNPDITVKLASILLDIQHLFIYLKTSLHLQCRTP